MSAAGAQTAGEGLADVCEAAIDAALAQVHHRDRIAITEVIFSAFDVVEPSGPRLWKNPTAWVDRRDAASGAG